MTGWFITFEGADGAGKTTQLQRLADYLRRQGRTVLCTREPGGTALGDKIREMLLDPANLGMNARTEALLYMAARAQHVAELILPALSRGEVVLSDRYADSTIVYQGAARQLVRDELVAINQFAAAGLVPDLTILLDAETNLLGNRRSDRGTSDRIELEGASFHEKVRQGFHELAAAQPERVKVVAAAGDIDKVHQAVVKQVDEFLHKGRRQ
ncbi:MAG: dTMP kinase [Negativicutes bacterium]|nr:dTMP kinase [Negativicutes bacterium]